LFVESERPPHGGPSEIEISGGLARLASCMYPDHQEIHRTAGEIAPMSSEPDAAKAQAHFERAIAVAREQKAKSWELRAATSVARLWRDQGKPQRARDLLARPMAGSPKASARPT